MYYMLPSITNSETIWDTRGFIVAVFLHILVSEPLYYGIHRLLHSDSHLFSAYHSHHHSSPVPHPFTAGNATFLEHVMLVPIMGIPVVGAALMGFGSLSLCYVYVFVFDFLRYMGHSNVEIFPHQIFEALPVLRYLLCTPTYHSLHHMEKDSNFCLFMPFYDCLGGTLNVKSWELQKQITLNPSKIIAKVPDLVFLAHMVDITSSIHAPFIFRSFSSLPYATRWFILATWPFFFTIMFMLWACAKVFTVSFYNFRNKLHRTWVIPRYGFQNEALNGGGMLFVRKHPSLRVRVVHGNTLTAAVTINQIPKDVKEVFLTGSTSKLGRAIALYLCRRQVHVLMLTSSKERFLKIQKEAPIDCQKYLIQVTKYQASANCKTWIVGKWITPRE